MPRPYNVLIDQGSIPVPQIETVAGTATEPWKGENNAGFIAGDTDHDVADQGRPVKIGGKAHTSEPAAVVNGNRANAYFDEYGRIHNKDDALNTAIGTTADADTQLTVIGRLKKILVTLTDGTQKAMLRTASKGATPAADVTSKHVGDDIQALHVVLAEPISGSAYLDHTFHTEATIIDPGTLLTVGGYKTLTIEVYGTATTSKVEFQSVGPSGVPRTLMGIRMADFITGTETEGLGESWQFDITGQEQIIMDLTVVSGGNVSVKGRCVA